MFEVTSGKTITNSSPPNRQIMPPSGRQDFIRSETAHKQLVTNRMTKRIIDGLEIVEIGKVERETIADHPPSLVFYLLGKKATVGQMRQRIIIGKLADFCFPISRDR